MNNDLISRSALIQDLQSAKYLCYNNNSISRIQNHEIDRCISFVEDAPTVELEVKLKEERPTGEWIPVSERLPDLFEVVLVTDECGKVFEYERRSLDEEGNVCEEWSFLGRKIIAWMPMPEPYKKGEEE